MNNGRVTLIHGPMFSSKSSELQERAKRALLSHGSVAFVLPAVDTRWGGNNSVTTHDGTSAIAPHVCVVQDVVEDPPDLPADTRFIFIDEGQFLRGLAEFCIRQRSAGRQVCVAALSSDSDGRPWPEISRLALAHADELVARFAVCVVCQGPARYTRCWKSKDATDNVQLGADETYAPVCWKHWDTPLTAQHKLARSESVQRARSLLVGSK